MRYIFGNYVLDTQCYELHRAGEPLKLRRKVFQVLAYLLAHRERVVPKQELLEHLWPGQFVGDETLKSCLKTLRKALGERGRTPHFVRTLHGQGYRFVAPVEERLDAPRGTAPPATLPSPDLPEASPPPLPTAVASPAAAAPPLPASPSPPPTALPPALQHLPTGERRQVTVLCGTLAHTTTLADRLGLEAFRHLVQTFHTLAQDCVQRYQGTIQTLGEGGVLALFGVPVAQEDHSWRAVRAALALQQRLREALPGHEFLPGEALTACVGVHTGWVVAGSRRDEPPQAVVVGGDTTQGAMRLQALAEPGTLVVSDMTLRLLRATVHSAASGLVRMPGHAEPLMAYTVQGLDASTATRVWSPFVGRQRELAVFDDLLARALAGQGQVVGLIGEPGIGKSRLLVEFRQRLPERPVTVLEGHCRAYNQLIPYGPISDLLRQQCGLGATVPPDVVATQVAQLLRAVEMSPEASTPYLLQLLGSPATAEPLAQLPPDVIKERTFATLRQVHLRSSQQQPLLLVVENLHWIDPTSEAYLASLVAQLAGVPLLLLTTYRPGYRPLWMDKSYATQLTLPPLTQEESATMVRAVLPPEHSAEVLVQRVLARAEGNPLFLEELAHAVQEQGGLGADTPVPETIQAVLAARIDRLPLEAKHLLHTAAVLGTEVPVPLLEAIAELPEAVLHRSLAHLQVAEFLYETRLVPEQVYTFKHALTHEVAYGSLLQERRRVLHACIVETLEALAGDQVAEVASGRSPDQVERLAHHALRGEVWDKALAYCRQAGEKAMARSAHREAVGYLEQALIAAQRLPAQHDLLAQGIELRLSLDSAFLTLGDPKRGFGYLCEAAVLAEALGDQRQLGRIANFMTHYFLRTGDYDAAIEYGQRALVHATASGAILEQAIAHGVLGTAYFSLGDYRSATDMFRRSVAALEGDLRHVRFTMSIPSVRSRGWLVNSLAEFGAFAEGMACGEEAARIAEAAGHLSSAIFAQQQLGMLVLLRGDLPQAIFILERALARCRATDITLYLHVIAVHLGLAYALSGRIPEALLLFEQVVEQAMGIQKWTAPILKGEGYLLAGNLEEARTLAERALALSRTHKARGNEAWSLRLLGEIALHGHPSDIIQAEIYYQQALALADERGMRPLQAHCHHGLGRLYCQIGRCEPARAALSTAIELYRAMEMTFWLPQAEAVLAQVA
jgi:DNA-binding winged helix-turn-helix (wHTH) protein/class 3 adenylate cyclase/tetratricopeptide (TPR) repeat protein